MKRILSVFLALILLISVSGITAFAAPEKAQRVKIEYSSKTLRQGKTYQLSERVYPDSVDYDSVKWSSSNEGILDVDRYGEVTAYGSGECTITCRVFAKDGGKEVRIGSGSVTFQVRDKDGNLPGEGESSSSTKSSSSSKSSSSTKSSSSSKSSSTSTTSKSDEKISAAAVTTAVKNSVIPGTTSGATFKDAGSISAAALQSAALEMKNQGGIVLLNFDTMNGKSVEGRLTINPIAAANVKDDIKLGVYTNESAVSNAKTKFQKWFKNNVVIIKAAHSGNYGMKVTYAVKIDSSLKNAKNLMLYSYDPDSNKYYAVKDSNIWLDSNSYVHFTTDLGDYLVISNGELVSK